MRDLDDPRDMLLMLDRVCKVAVGAGVDVGPLLESVAAISNDRSSYGWRLSIRDMMLDAERRFSSGRA
jgi:hypothetical protein